MSDPSHPIHRLLDNYEAAQARSDAESERRLRVTHQRTRQNAAAILTHLREHVLPHFEDARNQIQQRGYGCQVECSERIGEHPSYSVRILLGAGKTHRPAARRFCSQLQFEGEPEDATISIRMMVDSQEIPSTSGPFTLPELTDAIAADHLRDFLAMVFKA